MIATAFLLGMVAGGVLSLIATVVSQSLGNSHHSLSSSTNGTSECGSTLYGSTKNGVLRFRARDDPEDMLGSALEDWMSEEGTQAHG